MPKRCPGGGLVAAGLLLAALLSGALALKDEPRAGWRRPRGERFKCEDHILTHFVLRSVFRTSMWKNMFSSFQNFYT